MLGTYHRLGVHIDASDREVIREARKKLAHKARRSREWREARHRFYRTILAHHLIARDLAMRSRL